MGQIDLASAGGHFIQVIMRSTKLLVRVIQRHASLALMATSFTLLLGWAPVRAVQPASQINSSTIVWPTWAGCGSDDALVATIGSGCVSVKTIGSTEYRLWHCYFFKLKGYWFRATVDVGLQNRQVQKVMFSEEPLCEREACAYAASLTIGSPPLNISVCGVKLGDSDTSMRQHIKEAAPAAAVTVEGLGRVEAHYYEEEALLFTFYVKHSRVIAISMEVI